MGEHKVLPIKDSNVLKEVQDTLKDSFKYGIRNYTIFQVGKATLLRVSDVLALPYDAVFDENGKVKHNAFIHDKKTGKPNKLFLDPVMTDLSDYHDWLFKNNVHSQWLFPSLKKFKSPKAGIDFTNDDKHIDEKQFYQVMHKVGDLLSIDYLGTHTMRKTGAYRVYEQSGHDIALVMSLLNHSSQAMTLKYLGLDQVTKEQKLSKIDFG